MVDSMVTGGLRGQVDAALSTLTPNEERVLRLRFGLEGDARNRGEVGREVGLSRSRVRSIESHAFQHLRQASLLEFPAVECLLARRSVEPPLLESGLPPASGHRHGDRSQGQTLPPVPPTQEPCRPNDPEPSDVVRWEEV